MNSPNTPEISTLCYHCGEKCDSSKITFEDKDFCCQGCKLVYEVLSKNDLCEYYSIDAQPGKSQKNNSNSKNQFDYLDDLEVKSKLLDFQNEIESHVTFYIPLIHCASCIWLLENLFKINSAITFSRVDFVKKKIQIKFLHQKITLKEVVQLLFTLGYEPKINLSDLEKSQRHPLIGKR